MILKMFVTLFLGMAMIWGAGKSWGAGEKAPKTVPTAQAIQQHYLALGHVIYQDATEAAQKLDQAIQAFTQNPSAKTFAAAKKAYRNARIPYQQSEAFRFANPEIDDLEGQVNAWPVDEGLLDYVDLTSYQRDHPLAKANVIATPKISFSSKTLDFKTFTPEALRSLHEIDGEEGHVATGYHVLEFLLWGQDLKGHKFGAGERPYTDYDLKNCTGGHCDRRAAYLRAASALLVSDLKDMLQVFDEKKGKLARRVLKEDPMNTFKNIFAGLASMAYGELAGERIQLGLLLADPEEEHECFSDLTHLAHYYNVMGLEAIYTGSYTPTGTQEKIQGPSLSQWAQSKAPQSAAQLEKLFKKTKSSAQALYDAAEKGMSYDMMLSPENPKGNALIKNLVKALKEQSYGFTRLARDLAIPGHLQVLGSESLDNPKSVLEPEEKT